LLLVLRYWVLPVSALICAGAWTAIRLLMRVPVRRACLEALFAGYTGALCYVVFFLPVAASPAGAGSVWASVNLIPTRTMLGIIRNHRGMITWQLLGNVLLFVPLGFLLPKLSKRLQRFAVTVAAGFSVSVGVELVQLAMLLALASRRSVDVDDVILNVAGTCLGYLAWRATRRRIREAPAQRASGRRADARRSTY
jgi:glycopeptide antibiotics resistance protein